MSAGRGEGGDLRLVFIISTTPARDNKRMRHGRRTKGCETAAMASLKLCQWLSELTVPVCVLPFSSGNDSFESCTIRMPQLILHFSMSSPILMQTDP